MMMEVERGDEKEWILLSFLETLQPYAITCPQAVLLC